MVRTLYQSVDRLETKFCHTSIVDLPPDGSVLPSAWKVIHIAVRHRFRLDAARPDKVVEDTGKTVKWHGSFIEEMGKALVAARMG
jgi:POT family proton-dependent oligopeptide transporter